MIEGMKRYIAVWLLLLLAPAVAQSPTHLLVWWMEHYEPAVPQQGKLPPGALVFVQDNSPETTDYHLTAYYRNNSGEPRWVEGFVNRVRTQDGRTDVWTTKFLRADDMWTVDHVEAFAIKVTGYKDQTNPVCCGY